MPLEKLGVTKFMASIYTTLFYKLARVNFPNLLPTNLPA
jgi:hypothetical protein